MMVAYAVVAWLLLQAASIVFPAFDAPPWFMQLAIALLAVGFVITLMLAWVFDLTPRGIRRTRDEPAEEADPPRSRARRTTGFGMGALAILLMVGALLGWWAYFVYQSRTTSPSSAVADLPALPAGAAPPALALPSVAAEEAIPAKSIAVLPFDNLSTDPGNAYFVAGMHDLILTKLAHIAGLKVISRHSTEKYASRPEDLRVIAQELGVATVLEGTVQRVANQVMVNVQLIDAASGDHIWAESYTRTLEDVFGVEGEVAEKIAAALDIELSGTEAASLAAAPTTNREAMDWFLRAEEEADAGAISYDTARWKAAIPLYRKALVADPTFAVALAHLSRTESELAFFGGGGEDVQELKRKAHADAERALQLQPSLSAAHLAIGYDAYWGRGDYAAALSAFAAALALKPNDADALAGRGFVERRQGHPEAAIASLAKAVRLDPRDSSLVYEVGATYLTVGNHVAALQWLQRALALEPGNLNARVRYSEAILLGSGDIARAWAAVEGDAPKLTLQRAWLLTLQRKYREALALLESVPDTPDNFQPGMASKALQRAELQRLLGHAAEAKRLYQEARATARRELAAQQGIAQAFVWQGIADAEIGLGNATRGYHAIDQALAIAEESGDRYTLAGVEFGSARLYALAGRADLAVPMLARALASGMAGEMGSPVLLRLDPAWDALRDDPGFKALRARPAAPPAPSAQVPRGG